MLFAGLEVHIGKNCVLGLKYGLGPVAESHTREGGPGMARWENSRSNLKETCNRDMHDHVILVTIYLLTAVI